MRFPFFRNPLDALDWEWITNLYGTPLKYNLEQGVRYKLRGTIGPASQLRILDEHFDGRFAAESRLEHKWHLNADFTMTKDMGEYLLVQYIGEVEDIHFEIAGIDFQEFR